jgi:hypothetical protein
VNYYRERTERLIRVAHAEPGALLNAAHRNNRIRGLL